MKLRIIGGKFKGRSIVIPDEVQDFRPTKDMVREALSSILQMRVFGSTVLDLCCGSGVFGLEMISRGAVYCDFVDENSKRISVLEKNISGLNIKNSEYSAICSDAGNFLEKSSRKYDIVFYDPPYNNNKLSALAVDLPILLNPNGIIVYERDFTHENFMPDFGESFEVKIRKYGRTEIIFCTHN